MEANTSSNSTSAHTSTSTQAALSRRRSGLLAAHGNLSRRSLVDRLAERAHVSASEGRPIPPTREPSNPNLAETDSFHSRAFEDQDCNIPSMDMKIQTLLNLEGREFLHSSLRSPIPPTREPSVIFPSGHSRSTIPSTIPSSGHSRSTIPLEEQERPTSIPDFDTKEKTMQGSYLHASTNCPIQPVREPSVTGLNVSMHSDMSSIATPYSMYSTPYSIPSLTSMPTIRSQSDDEHHSAGGEEDDDIFSEEESEVEESERSTVYEDIRIDYPLLGPGPLGPVLPQRPPPSSTASLTHSVTSYANASYADSSVMSEADELRALKQYWSDLGQRIDAMEARGIQNSLSVLGDRLDAISRKSLQRAAERPAFLGPAPSEKSKSKSRSSSSAKSAPPSTLRKRSSRRSLMSSTKSTRSRSASVDASRGRRKSRRSKNKERSTRSVSRTPTTKNGTSRRSHNKSSSSPTKDTESLMDGSRTSRRSTTNTTKDNNITESSLMDGSRTSRRNSATREQQECMDGSRGCMDGSKGSRGGGSCCHCDGSGASPNSSRRRMGDGSNGCSSTASTRRMGDGSNGSTSLNCSRHRMERHLQSHGRRSSKTKLMDGSSESVSVEPRRRSSGSRKLADAADSVDLTPRRKSTTRRIKPRSSKLTHGSDGVVKSEGDLMRERKALSRSPGSSSASLSRSPGKKVVRSRHRMSHRDQGASLSSMPAVLGDLDGSSKREEQVQDVPKLPPKSPKDTMDVEWWRFHQQQHDSNRSLVSKQSQNRLQASRMGKSLVF